MARSDAPLFSRKHRLVCFSCRRLNGTSGFLTATHICAGKSRSTLDDWSPSEMFALVMTMIVSRGLAMIGI